MLLVGLTGGIGAGKSSVAALLAERGAVILDADQVARDVVEPDQPAFAALVERFGPEIVLQIVTAIAVIALLLYLTVGPPN